MKPMPETMTKGSIGPHVTIVHVILCMEGFGQRLVPDMEWGDETDKAFNLVQRGLGVSDGGTASGGPILGPRTRVRLITRFELNLEQIWRTIPGVTRFVQADGSVVEWGPHL